MAEEKNIQEELNQETVENTDAEATENTETAASSDAKAAETETAKEEKKASKKKAKTDKKQDALKEKVDELEDKVKRQMAEFENFRKRTEREKAQMIEIGAKDIIEKILPVVDNFERGFAGLSEEELATPGIVTDFSAKQRRLSELYVDIAADTEAWDKDSTALAALLEEYEAIE